MPHPLVLQLRFTRSEFIRGVRGVSDADGARRFEPMNAIGWNVGHLAWQEQEYFLALGQDRVLFPEIRRDFAYGAPASTPPLSEVLAAWREITTASDPWLDALTTELLVGRYVKDSREFDRRRGDRLQRVVYHYWYHTGENAAIRQLLGHRPLPQFVDSLDDKAPYTPEDA